MGLRRIPPKETKPRKMIRFVYITLLLLTTLNLSAQDKVNVRIGASYQPMFFIQENPLHDISLIPSLDVLIQDNTTALKISLGTVNRIGMHISGNNLVFAFNYGYHINQPEGYKHSMEFELGSCFDVGKDKDYLFTLSSKIGFFPGVNVFYFMPVSIGLFKMI